MVYRILDIPQIYDFVQRIFLLGRTRALNLIENMVKSTSRGRVLDVGCGTGKLADMFESDYHGIDLNVKYLTHKSGKGRQFVCGNAVMLPFKDNAFDFVFSVFFFHHIDREGTSEVFKEMIRVGKADSTMLVIDWFRPEGKFDLLGRMVSALDRGKHGRCKETFIRELQDYFDIIDVHSIDYSYPYNYYAFMLKAKD